jgi:hypothetical protein
MKVKCSNHIDEVTLALASKLRATLEHSLEHFSDPRHPIGDTFKQKWRQGGQNDQLLAYRSPPRRSPTGVVW